MDEWCCDSFREASKPGTDHEQYGAAICSGRCGGWSVGVLPDIQFCPWCGAKLPELKEWKEIEG
jgi:hypothetical protein